MHKSPNIIFSFTLPFFIALMFMLSTFTYTVGDMFQTPVSRPPKKADIKADNVLGITHIISNEGESRERPEPEVIIESVDPSVIKPYTYSSVVNNADGTKSKIDGFLDNGQAKVTVTHFDMFGELISENTYSAQEYESIRTSSNTTRKATEGMVTLDTLPEKLEGLGYTYNPTKITLEKDNAGSSFKVPAHSTQRLFGLFKVNLPVVLLVNSADGNVTISKTLLVNFLDLISN
jgi:hypothetical protein